MSKSIRLSEKHGVNPSIERCFICGKDFGLVLFGRMKNDEEAPREVCLGNVCDECKGIMKEGVFLIECDQDKSDDSNDPYRTGRVAALREDAFARMAGSEHPGLKSRVVYVEIGVFEKLGIECEE